MEVAAAQNRLAPTTPRMSAGHSRHAAVLLLVLALGATLLGGCFGGEEEAAGDGKAAVSGDVEVKAGERAELGDVRVYVTSLGPVAELALPALTLARGPVPRPAEGQQYYQARVRVANQSGRPVRVDPLEFLLRGEDGMIAPDLAGSGPPARSLLPSTSIHLLLTYRAPADLAPELHYAPSWFPGTLTVTGARVLAGQADPLIETTAADGD